MEPPYLPEENPVGVYRCGDHHPAGVGINGRYSSASMVPSRESYLYINVREAGYSEDSKTTAEFRITPYAETGKNSVAIKIFRWSTGSYWRRRISGALVASNGMGFLWSRKPRTSLRDFRVKSTDESYRDGIFELETTVANYGRGASAAEVSYELPNERVTGLPQDPRDYRCNSKWGCSGLFRR